MLRKKVVVQHKNLFVLISIIGFTLLAIYGNSISPDYFSYREIVSTVAVTKDPFVHIEIFYIWLIHKIGNNFFYYQVCIYIPLFTTLYFIITRGFKIENPIMFCLLFAIIGLYPAIVGRFFLFNIVYLFAIILFVRKQYFGAVLFLICSFFLHKVSTLAIPVAILLLFPLRFSYGKFTRFIILLICLSLLGRHIINNYLGELLMQVADLKGSDYLTKKEGMNEGGSLWWQVIYTYQLGFRYILSLLVLYKLRSYNDAKQRLSQTMYKLLFWLVCCSIFFISLGLPDNTIAGRLFSISTIPLCYLFSLWVYNKKFNLGYRILFILGCMIYLIFTNAYIIGVSHIHEI